MYRCRLILYGYFEDFDIGKLIGCMVASCEHLNYLSCTYREKIKQQMKRESQSHSNKNNNWINEQSKCVINVI